MEKAASGTEQFAYNLFLAKRRHFPDIDLTALQICRIGLFR